VQRQGAGRGDDAAFVDFDAGYARHIRPGGNHDCLGLYRLGFAVSTCDVDLAGCRDPAGAEKSIDLVLLEEEGDAFDVAIDPRVLEFHHGGKIELGLIDPDAQLVEHVAGLFIALGGMQQCLRRNAADVETGPPKGLVFLDDRNLHAELRCADGTDISPRPGTDDDEVISHDALHLPWSSIGARTAAAEALRVKPQSTNLPPPLSTPPQPPSPRPRTYPP